jgi:hypothetical protein
MFHVAPTPSRRDIDILQAKCDEVTDFSRK